MFQIGVEIDPARARLWHKELIERLRGAGYPVALLKVRRAPPSPAALDLLMSCERLVHRQFGAHPASRLPGDALVKLAGPQDATRCDVLIDLSGGLDVPDDRRRLRPLYAGSPLEEAAADALLAGSVPMAGVHDSAAPDHPAVYRIAVEDPRLIFRGFGQICSRMASILFNAVERIGRGEVLAGDAAIVPRARAWTLARSAASFAETFASAVRRLQRRDPHWYVGYRFAGADRMTETLALPATGYRRVPDDGKRFYADPYMVSHHGRNFMFIEELPFTTGKGFISVMEVLADGTLTAARPVLEEAHHLSYPFVFEEGGQFWLIPESFHARRIDLYRAVEFPHKWAFEATLVDNIDASDPTLLRHGGRYWLFATVGEGGTSTWDALHLWSSPGLMGPWTAHADNPVILDALGARPGGAFFMRGDALWRPCMDCRTGYGVGLAMARVDELSEAAFKQTIERTIHPSGAWPGIALHTINWAGGIEVVDGCQNRGEPEPRPAPPPRLP